MNPNRFQQSHIFLKAIITINIIFFCISLFLSGRGIQLTLNPFTALSPSVNSLIFLGAAGTIPIDKYHEWWSLLAANWLHGSLIHLLFNMTALLQITPFIIREYGKHRMVIIYTLTGMGGFFLSYLAGVKITIGASAAICGLIGAALYFGKSRGGIYGQNVFKQTSGWVFGILLIGILIPNINNWGHGGGLVGGIFLGWVLGYNAKRKETFIYKILSYTCILCTGAVLVWASISAIILSI